MQNYIFNVFLTIATFLCLCQPLFAWDKVYTHPALSQEAANYSQVGNYLQNQLGYTEGLNTQLQITNTTTPFVQDLIDRGMDQSITTRSVLEWIREGSELEDALIRQARSQHHFHDPVRNAGLDNRTDHPYWEGVPTLLSPFDLRGESALFWIITGTSSTGYPRNNQETWSATRDKFYSALTSLAKSTREQYMAETFISLGHVLHMVEDMGVPAHTRNDFLFAHYRSVYTRDYGNPLEMWAERQVDATSDDTIPANWLTGWTPTPKVYSKVSDYFDTDTRDANSYLGDGVSPPATWGLAEATNYQFFSWSTISPLTSSLYYFPHPDIDRCDVKEELGRTYLYGYAVDHLARFTMSEDFLEHGHLEQAWCTLGEAIYDDYATITIPRTIDYATGLINYFFRGQLNVEPNWADPNIVELVITNDSNNSGVEQVLKGGVFELYWDDSDSNRAEVPVYTIFESNIPGETSEWDEDSILEYGYTIRAEFNQPEAEGIRGYTLVYQGSISEDPFKPDPCDPNAIAVAVFQQGYPIIAWGYDNHGQVSNVPDGNEFIAVAAGKWHCIAINSDGSLAGWGYNEHDECNVPAGNDYVDISAGQRHSMALKSDGSIVVWGSDNLNQITDKPDGNDFTAITAGDWHSLAIKSDGTIVGWGGWNSYEECNAPEPDAGTVYIDIAAGTYHSLALQSDGVVKAWGNNNNGQTTIYGGAAGKVHEAVAAGGNYCFLLRDDDVLISWGGGDWISPGVPRYHYRYADGNDFTFIAAGTDHIMALTSDGRAFDWDWPDGDFPFDYFDRPVPSDVVFVEDIDGGYDFSVALRLP